MHPAPNSLLDKAARIGWLFTAAAMLLVFSQFLSPALVDEKRYIRESYEIRLKDYEVVAHEFFHHFFHPEAHTYLIKADGRYYAFYYYQKNKKDHSHWSLSNTLHYQPRKIPLYIPVHPSEIQRGAGTRDNPIHVLNYGTEPGAYRWDDKSYRYNIARDAFCRKILRCGTIGNGFYHLLAALAVLGILLFFIAEFKRVNKN